MPILGYTRGRVLFTACPLLSISEGTSTPPLEGAYWGPLLGMVRGTPQKGVYLRGYPVIPPKRVNIMFMAINRDPLLVGIKRKPLF